MNFFSTENYQFLQLTKNQYNGHVFIMQVHVFQQECHNKNIRNIPSHVIGVTVEIPYGNHHRNIFI